MRSASMRRDFSARSMPRRVVSTSGGSGTEDSSLFDLGFLVRDVLAHDRVELAYFHLVRMQPLVLHCDVEMAGTGRGQQFDLFAHAPILLELDAASAQIREHRLEAVLLDRTKCFGRDAQAPPALFVLEPEALRVQIGQEAPPLAVIGMRDGIPRDGPLARDLTDPRHEHDPPRRADERGAL